MKHIILPVVICASLLTSCISRFDYSISFNEQEQLQAMQGTWKLTAASTQSAIIDNNGEEHLYGNLSTSLEKVEITESDIIFTFTDDIDLYEVVFTDSEMRWEYVNTGDSFTFRHDILNIPDVAFANLGNEGARKDILLTGYYSGTFTFFTRDDVTAHRMIISFSDTGYYFEFERQ